jgi:hypothetical protein
MSESPLLLNLEKHDQVLSQVKTATFTIISHIKSNYQRLNNKKKFLETKMSYLDCFITLLIKRVQQHK